MKSVIWIALLGAGVSACSGTGDFGRKPYSVLDDKIIPVISKGAKQSRGKPVSWYPLTAAERRMRQSADSLVMPYGRPVFLEPSIRRIERAAMLTNTIAWNAPERYLSRLKREKFASGEARIRFIEKHILQDQWQFRNFTTQVWHVIAADKKRLAALFAMRDKRLEDFDNTLGRVAENRSIIRVTLRALALRMRGYDKALRLTQLQYPDISIDETGAKLIELKSQADKTAARARPYLSKGGRRNGRGPVAL